MPGAGTNVTTNVGRDLASKLHFGYLESSVPRCRRNALGPPGATTGGPSILIGIADQRTRSWIQSSASASRTPTRRAPSWTIGGAFPALSRRRAVVRETPARSSTASSDHARGMTFGKRRHAKPPVDGSFGPRRRRDGVAISLALLRAAPRWGQRQAARLRFPSALTDNWDSLGKCCFTSPKRKRGHSFEVRTLVGPRHSNYEP